MALDDFAQGIVQNLVSEAIVASIVGFGVITWLKKRGSSWLTPLGWGLVGAVLILIGAAAIRTLALPIPAAALPINPDTVEARIREWLENFNIPNRSEPTKDARFVRIATLQNGNIIRIFGLREREKYVILQMVLLPSKSDQDLLDKLPQGQFVQLVQEMKTEVARSKTNFSTGAKPLVMALEKRIPITNDLSEAAFIRELDELDSTGVLVQGTVTRFMREHGLVK